MVIDNLRSLVRVFYRRRYNFVINDYSEGITPIDEVGSSWKIDQSVTWFSLKSSSRKYRKANPSGWVKLKSYGNGTVFFDLGNDNDNENVRLIFDNASTPSLHAQIFDGTNGENLLCTENVGLDQWTFVVLTLSGDSLSFFINNELINTLTTTYRPNDIVRTFNYLGRST